VLHPDPRPRARARRRAADPDLQDRRREALAGREEARRLQGDLRPTGDLDELERLCDGEPARLADVEIRRAQR